MPPGLVVWLPLLWLVTALLLSRLRPRLCHFPQTLLELSLWLLLLLPLLAAPLLLAVRKGLRGGRPDLCPPGWAQKLSHALPDEVSSFRIFCRDVELDLAGTFHQIGLLSRPFIERLTVKRMACQDARLRLVGVRNFRIRFTGAGFFSSCQCRSNRQ